MYTENLENNTCFEIGRTYYYHFSCNYDSLSFMQIVSVSDSRKTAVIQQLIGGKPSRRKIYNYSGIETISAGNYSMAGSWSADEWDKSELLESLDIDFMHEHERAEALEVLPELPAAAPVSTVYTVDVYFCKDYNFYGKKLLGISLADMVKYVSNNTDIITDVLGEKWYIDFTLYKNGEYLCDSVTGKTTGGDILDELSYKISEKEYNAVLAEISNPDNDPDPTKPTGKPDCSAFDVEDFWNYVIFFEEIPGPEQIDENQITFFDEITAYSANAAADICTVSKSPIDETAAKRGHESYSLSDYKSGSAIAEYNAAIVSVKAAADNVREHIPEEYRGDIDRLVNRYAAKLADWTNRKNRADASCPLWLITEAANYPHRKYEKQMQRLDSLFEEYDKITTLEERIKNFDCDCKHCPIKSGDSNALEKLRAKVEELTALQNQMKQDNTEARRRGEPAPYGSYSLSNNRQNLKRYADRLAALEKAKAIPAEQAAEICGEGFRIVRNTDIMRLQFIFDGKPDERMRTLLKSNGFKWVPSQMAWQRQLTNNAERAACAVVNAIQ